MASQRTTVLGALDDIRTVLLGLYFAAAGLFCALSFGDFGVGAGIIFFVVGGVLVLGTEL
ncbi:hypothetical protein AUR64_15470 [Haloprofundus marisrubri]|uniref:Uncharacterized protein n=1 Tax=Haloprofundus marisrubri TaxID=1514971 RepID=A0A0W1R7T7_9EURY|nr:hypothetical protein [Haloprofundus marisrubri]KTG09191.1 hypothetical protein AUR64_15470 [Haloprofundus marisrubri]